ncbi:MAG: hypothetical protein JKY94_16510 [Rhodobacteraceae bacterium]|nr:hypothetical protein [Paracoccaceae bacterium]
MNTLAPAPIVIGFTGPRGVSKSTIARAIGIQLAMQRPPVQSEDMSAILHIAEPLMEMLVF